MQHSTIKAEVAATLLETHTVVRTTVIPGMVLTELATDLGDVMVIQGVGSDCLLIRE